MDTSEGQLRSRQSWRGKAEMDWTCRGGTANTLNKGR